MTLKSIGNYLHIWQGLGEQQPLKSDDLTFFLNISDWLWKLFSFTN